MDWNCIPCTRSFPLNKIFSCQRLLSCYLSFYYLIFDEKVMRSSQQNSLFAACKGKTKYNDLPLPTLAMLKNPCCILVLLITRCSFCALLETNWWWQVKLVKCMVQNLVVDISVNQIGGLSTLCFLEQVGDCFMNLDCHLMF